MSFTKLRMRFPSRMADSPWKEALPIGNGKSGALLLGAVGEEFLWVNHYDRWDGSDEGDTIPDVSNVIHEMRALQKEGKFHEANGLLSKALSENGYRGNVGGPSRPAGFRMLFDSDYPFRDYERGIDITTGEAYVTFTQNGFRQTRRAFVSRSTDTVFMDVASQSPMNVRIITDFPDGFNCEIKAFDGDRENAADYIMLSGCTHFVIRCAYGKISTEGYAAELETHIPLHRAALGSASLNISDEDSFGDILLEDVYLGSSSTEVYEKLWYMGRYLFACGTAPDAYPFPLYGLWHGVGNPVWAQHVANENVEMIYWHTLTGGYAPLVKPLIHYYFNMMDTCREAASKIFGCKGIFVSVYSTPVTRNPSPNVPVIINYIGVAGWLSRQFYDYYRYTRDRKLLESEILPFMLEAAEFYSDYAVKDESGHMLLSPSVSPENTPKNLMPGFKKQPMGHPCPAVCNATMEIAIVKELFTHLLEINEELPLPKEKVARWKQLLSSIPDYMVNEDGAVREWMDERLLDNYSHRHLSHIYPLFPGDEISCESPLYGAFEKAVDLRKLGSQSGWSLAHMASIYCRLFRGDRALECLNTMARSCLLSNFMTQHNDWRGMGLTLTEQCGQTIQLDALMGAVNAIQEMLLKTDRDAVRILPACPSAFGKGSFAKWHIPGALISAEWDIPRSFLKVTVEAERDISTRLVFPSFSNRPETIISLQSGEKIVL